MSGGPTGRAPDVDVRGRKGRTPDFSVQGTTGPAGVEGEGRAAGFQLPSPSLSPRQETRAAKALLRHLSALGEGDVPNPHTKGRLSLST